MILGINDGNLIENMSPNPLDINKFVKKKILLISLCSYQSFTTRIFHAIIKKKTIVSSVFFKKDTSLKVSEKEYGLLINLVKELNPDIIGVSVRTPFFSIAKNITERIRKVSNAKIIWGGVHAIINPEESVGYADFVCHGEGEIPLKNFFENDSLEGFFPNNRVLTSDLNKLPTPDFEDENKYYIERDKLHFGDPINKTRVYHIMGSRGCPFSCSYCINSNIKKLYEGQKYLRLRSVDSVLNELNAIKKSSKNLKRILFMDEIFALGNKEWVEEFVKGYKKEINLPFGISYRPDWVKEDVLIMLKDAGLDNVFIGIESGSERIRKEVFNRNVSDKQLLECQKVFKKVGGVISVYNLIVKNPFETVEDLKKGFELIIQFPKPFSFHILKLVVFPKTDLSMKLPVSIDESLNYVPSMGGEDDFWINLISLSSKEFIPKKVLVFISKNGFFAKHQFFVYSLVRVSNWAKFIIEGFRFVSKEGFSYSILLTFHEDFKKFWSGNR